MTNGERPAGPTDRIERIEVALEILVGSVHTLGVRVDQLTVRIDQVATIAEEANRTATNAVISLVDGLEQLGTRLDSHAVAIRDLQTDNRRILDILERRFGDQSP